MNDTFVVVLSLLALLASGIELIRARFQSLLAWAVVALAVALMLVSGFVKL